MCAVFCLCVTPEVQVYFRSFEVPQLTPLRTFHSQVDLCLLGDAQKESSPHPLFPGQPKNIWPHSACSVSVPPLDLVHTFHPHPSPQTTIWKNQCLLSAHILRAKRGAGHVDRGGEQDLEPQGAGESAHLLNIRQFVANVM